MSYPIFSKINYDKARTKNAVRLVNKLTIFLYLPVILLLVFNAEYLVLISIGEKWRKIIPLFQILCLGSIVDPLVFYSQNIIKSYGKSSLILKLTLILKSIIVSGLIFVVHLGIQYIVLYEALGILFFALVYLFISGKQIKYYVRIQIADILPEFLTSILAITLAYGSTLTFNLDGLPNLMINIFLSFFFLILISEISKLDSYLFVKNNLLPSK